MIPISSGHGFLSLLSEEPLLARLFFGSIEMGAIALVVWALTHVKQLQSARLMSLLWLLVLAKPLAALIIGAPLAIIQIRPPQAEPVARTYEPSFDYEDTVPSLEPEAVLPLAPAEPGATGTAPPGGWSFSWKWSAAETIAGAWIIGAILVGLYGVLDRLRVHRLVSRARPAPDHLAARYSELTRSLRIKRPPRLRVTDMLESPALVGTIGPTILLPAWMADRASDAQLDWSLRHELTHWKLGDTFADLVRQIAKILFFFHPVTWWASRKWEEYAELACDRVLVGTECEAESYAGELYQMLAQIHGRRMRPAMGGLFATRTQIGRRIAALLSNPLKSPARLGALASLCLIAAALISCTVGGTVASKAHKEGEGLDSQSVSSERQADRPVRLAAASTDAREQKTDLTVRFTAAGRVADSGGRPVQGARVVLYHDRNRWGLGNGVVEQTVSEADGRYRFKAPISFERTISHSYAQDSYAVIATHPDHAFAWKNIQQGKEMAQYHLVMTRPVSCTVTVTDMVGDRLKGVRVWLYSAGDRSDENPLFWDYLHLPTDIGLIGAATDATGKAVITNLPDTGCSFHASLKGYAVGLAFPGSRRIRLTKGATVGGTVTTLDGEPLPDAVVSLAAQWMHQYFLAKTDKQGRYRFEDLPAEGWDMSPWGNTDGANGAYKITLRSDDYTIPVESLTLKPGELIEDLDLAAERGTLIICSVVDAETGKPVSGARLWGGSRSGRLNGYTNQAGIFKVRVIPGETSLHFQSPPEGVYIPQQHGEVPGSHLRFVAEGDEMTVTLKAPPVAGLLIPVPGRVIGPDDAELASAVVYASAGEFKSATKGSYVPAVGVNQDGTFEFSEVPAGRTLHVYAETEDRRRAGTGVFEIPADPGDIEPILIRLTPTQKASTIIRHESGEPIKDLRLTIRPVVEDETIWFCEHPARTDANGRLEVGGILPGLKYHLRDAIVDEGMFRTSSGESPFSGTFTLIPAGTVTN
jgi:beta-lactamase regulating signal transducer with metallopeptidase domain